VTLVTDPDEVAARVLAPRVEEEEPVVETLAEGAEEAEATAAAGEPGAAGPDGGSSEG
jgi:nicotinamide mononucleotide (NMN) deamidase PncC